MPTHTHTAPAWMVDSKGTLSSSYPPCMIIMPHLSQRVRQGDNWFSQPFYSAPGGYKLCLQVDARRRIGKEERKYVSVNVFLMKGENDDRLQWPFQHTMTCRLLNWKQDSNHSSETITFEYGPKASNEPAYYLGRPSTYKSCNF